MGKLAEVDDVAAARYIGFYLSMESYHVRKYISGAGWVFPGWIGFSHWLKNEFGIYPPREMLISLAKKSEAEREERTWLGVYLWEVSKTKGRKEYEVSVMV